VQEERGPGAVAEEGGADADRDEIRIEDELRLRGGGQEQQGQQGQACKSGA
jgi:hypothetical protein